MLERNPSIENNLAWMKQRLDRAQIVKRTIVEAANRFAPLEEKLDPPVYIVPASIARTETLLNPEHKITLKDKVEKIRKDIFRYGKHGRDIADYEEKITYGHRTPTDMEGYYELEGEEPFVEIVAEKNPTHKNENKFAFDFKLSLFVMEEDRHVSIDFGFENDFLLTIDFINPASEQTVALYHADTRRLIDDMTNEEAQIIKYYLDQLIMLQAKRKEGRA
jgi:hypothetical protein